MTSPEATYRGTENQLYRVEIHDSNANGGTATFKWSRENGSVIFPIIDIGDKTITLEHLGRDDRFGLQINDWVEVLDDDVILSNKDNGLDLLQVTGIDRNNFRVTLSASSPIGFLSKKHPYLRRWDQKKDADKDGVKISEDNWMSLEDGIEIQFVSPHAGGQQPRYYQGGDYWLILARTATGDVEWPDRWCPAAWRGSSLCAIGDNHRH